MDIAIFQASLDRHRPDRQTSFKLRVSRNSLNFLPRSERTITAVSGAGDIRRREEELCDAVVLKGAVKKRLES